MQRSGAGGIRAVLALLAGVCCAVAVVVAGSGVPAGASADIAPGACGSVLLAGSAWLGGLGVDVRSNGQDEGTGADCSAAQSKVGGVPAGEEWQCPELVNRLYLSRGWITETWHGSAGPALWDDTPGQLQKQPNGSVSYLGPGDVVIINVLHDGTPDGGHALIVNDSSLVSSGTVDLVSQNSGQPGNAEPQVPGVISGGRVTVGGGSASWTYQTIGVVHAPVYVGAAVRTVATSDGHIQVFEVAGGVIKQNWYSPVTGQVGGWTQSPALAAQATGTPALVARAGQKVIDAFVRGGNGQVYETWYNWGNGAWGGWIGLGGSVSSDPVALATSDGHDQVFATGNGRVEQNWFAPSNGAIGDWISFLCVWARRGCCWPAA